MLVAELESLCEEAFNELLFFRSKVKLDQQVVVVGANERVKQAFASADASPGGELHSPRLSRGAGSPLCGVVSGQHVDDRRAKRWQCAAGPRR